MAGERPEALDDDYGAPGGGTAQVALVEALFAAFAARDVDAVLRRVAADVVLDLPTAQMAGRDGPYRGRAGVRAYYEDLQRLWDVLSVHADGVRAAAGGAIVFGRIEGRTGGVEVRRQVVWAFRLRDGLAVGVRVNDLGPA